MVLFRCTSSWNCLLHYNDVIKRTMASQTTVFSIVYSTVGSDAHQRIHQSSAPLDFVRGIHRCPVNFPHKRPVTRKMFPFMTSSWLINKLMHMKFELELNHLIYRHWSHHHAYTTNQVSNSKASSAEIDRKVKCNTLSKSNSTEVLITNRYYSIIFKTLVKIAI